MVVKLTFVKGVLRRIISKIKSVFIKLYSYKLNITIEYSINRAKDMPF